MKHSITLLLALIVNLNAFTQTKEDYILNYAFIAVSEMEETKIPASITLAQGILESRYGTSELTEKSNNHFGIKCHKSWQGGRVFHDDDKIDDCFRVYNSPEQSFKDHSNFLLRKRYENLFKLPHGDYKGWAKGLKKAGYATDKNYPEKLIQIVEEYKLYKFDYMTSNDVYAYVQQQRGLGNPILYASAVKPVAKKVKNTPMVQRKEAPVNSITTVQNVNIKVPTSNEDVNSFKMNRAIFEVNDINTVHSYPTDTPKAIADRYNISFDHLITYNEWDIFSKEFKGGMNIYLQPKRKKVRNKNLKFHTVKAGETMYQIAQKYGLKTKSLYRLNAMDYDRKEQPTVGSQISLRKQLKAKSKSVAIFASHIVSTEALIETSDTIYTAKNTNSYKISNHNSNGINNVRKATSSSSELKVIKPAGQSISEQLPSEGGVQSLEEKEAAIKMQNLYNEQLESNNEVYQGRAIIYDETPDVNSQPVVIYNGPISNSEYSDNTHEDVTQPVSNSYPHTVHVVKKGDTLYSISRKNNVSVNQLKQWNNLHGNTIKIGQRLAIKK